MTNVAISGGSAPGSWPAAVKRLAELLSTGVAFVVDLASAWISLPITSLGAFVTLQSSRSFAALL